jgi:preprotein translocase subunit SecG
MFSSARSAEETLNRISWTLLAIFIGLAIVLSAGWLGK